MKRFVLIGLVITSSFLRGMNDDRLWWCDPSDVESEEGRAGIAFRFVDAVKCNSTPNVKRFWEWGAATMTHPKIKNPQIEHRLWTALRNCGSESLDVVEFLLSKGIDVNYLYENKSMFQATLEKETGFYAFKEKKPKILAIMSAGVKVDFDMIKSVVAAKKEKYNQKPWLPCRMTPAQWEELEKLIRDTVQEGAAWRAELPAIVAETLSVSELASLIGPYAHPYYDTVVPVPTQNR